MLLHAHGLPRVFYLDDALLLTLLRVMVAAVVITGVVLCHIHPSRFTDRDLLAVTVASGLAVVINLASISLMTPAPR